MFHTNSTDDPSFSWKAYTEEEMEETTLRWKRHLKSLQSLAQGHCKHGLHHWETEGAGSSSTTWRTELLCCLRSSQGGQMTWIDFPFNLSSPASSALGLSSWVLWSLPWGRSWPTWKSLRSRGQNIKAGWMIHTTGLPRRSMGTTYRSSQLPWLFSWRARHTRSRPSKCLSSHPIKMWYWEISLRLPSTTPRLLRSDEPTMPVLALLTSR